MTTTLARAAVGAATAALLLTPGVALAAEQDPPLVQLCTDIQAETNTNTDGSVGSLSAGLQTRIAELLDLGVTASINEALTGACGDPAEPEPTDTTTPPPPAPDEPFYENCAAAIAAGVAPINRANGEAGYRPELDSDGDGIACEANEADAGGGTPPATSGPTTAPTTPDTGTGGSFSQLDEVPTQAAETGGGPA